MANLLLNEPETSGGSFTGSMKQVGRGLLEAVPVYGERLAEKAGLPMPSTTTERVTRRASRNLPYALGALGTGVGAIPAVAGLVGSTIGGSAAEEADLPDWAQTSGEVVGGAVPQIARSVAGKTIGYIEPQLQDLYKKAKGFFEVGPGARSAKGMKYGSGEDPEMAIRNLNKFTKESTRRAGSETTNVDAGWLDKTQKTLGTEANTLFANKQFSADPQFLTNVVGISQKAQSAFGEQGNVVKSILEQNIGGKRPGGALVSPTFNGEDLRSAIVEVNNKLDGATGNQAKLLHDLKDALEDLAEVNLNKISPSLANQYNQWKKKYSSFATIRDISQRAGTEGLTAAGQINPQAASNVIASRTGGQPIRNPLHENLAKFGKILPYKKPPTTSLPTALYQEATENPLAKALGLSIQPKVRSKLGGRAATAQTISPTQRFTQTSSDEE